MFKNFRGSLLVTFLCLALAAWWGSAHDIGVLSAIWITCVLAVLEISFSFDNAVVNASILKEMDARWQTLFLTVGILIAVFGMRLFFPIAIVAAATSLDMASVTKMALDAPEEYALHLAGSHAAISAFGGVFLLLIFLSFLFDEGRKLHWLGKVEEKLARLGKLESIEIMVTLLVLLGMYRWMPLDLTSRTTILAAGILGVVLFIAVSSLDRFFKPDNADEAEVPRIGNIARRNGATAFLYLEVLDATFSFDGVIGAFALTRDVVIIMLGLAIGAMFVRSLTVHLVKNGVLENYVFLEHGAHYAIGALAAIMLAGIVAHIPEAVTGLVGAVFIVLAICSSIRYRKAREKEAG